MTGLRPDVDRSKTKRPFLTVVMPLHDGAEWIGTTLGALAREPIEDVEVIAIDSSPTATTLEIVERFTDRLSLRVIQRRDLVPWPTKTNLAVELASADYVCMLHQDDLWLTGRIDAIRHWIKNAPAAVLHLAPALFVDRNGKPMGRWRCPLPSERELDRDLLLERLLVQNFVSVPAPVIRRQAWLDCGGLDDSLWYTADWDIWLKLASAGPTVYHEDITVGFRVHSGSLTVTGSRSKDDFQSQMVAVLERHLDDLPALRGGAIEQRARASIEINVAMAAASSGDGASAVDALTCLLRLGPHGLPPYLRDSRLYERLGARVRARLRGVF